MSAGSTEASSELGIGAIGVTPDRVLAVMAELRLPLDRTFVDLDAEAGACWALEVPVYESEDGAVNDIVEELVAEVRERLLLDQDVRRCEVDL